MNVLRLRRSALFLPSSNARAIEKAATLDADVIIFDLEDAVAPDDKCRAREQACHAVTSRDFGDRELVIRINAAGTPWHADDLRLVAQAAPDAILLAKAEHPEQIQAVSQALRAKQPSSSRTRLWCMLETPRGILSAERIASATELLDCLVLGTSDLTNELHAVQTPTRAALATSIGLCLLAARAYGKSILDGVCLDLSNENTFASACQQGRELGFDGKTLIHPRQIAACNAAYSPTETEIGRAREVIAGFAKASAEGRGVAVVGGRLVEELHVREAERTLATAAEITRRGARLQ
jgi:citrate lyase subunit beta / citryl-CoA lyase